MKLVLSVKCVNIKYRKHGTEVETITSVYDDSQTKTNGNKAEWNWM